MKVPRFLVTGLVLIAAAACARGRYEKTVERISERVSLVQFYPCEGPGCELVSPLPSRQILVVGGKETEVPRDAGQVLRVFDECRTVFLLTQCVSGRCLASLGNDGKIVELGSLVEIGANSILGLSCETTGVVYRLGIQYEYITGDFEAETRILQLEVPIQTALLSSSRTPSGLIEDENEVGD